MDKSRELAQSLGQLLFKRKWLCAVAESCTGGGVSAALTEIPGSSKWFDRGLVTYTNASKQQLLDVPEKTLASFGAVSEQTVIAMAEGVLKRSDADISVAISGIAGPSGATEDKPVGTVWIAWAAAPVIDVEATCFFFEGDRSEIRSQAIAAALEGMIRLVCRYSK